MGHFEATFDRVFLLRGVFKAFSNVGLNAETREVLRSDLRQLAYFMYGFAFAPKCLFCCEDTRAAAQPPSAISQLFVLSRLYHCKDTRAAAPNVGSSVKTHGLFF